MHESSKSIASLAAALAKAQAELVNPEKTQVGILESDKPSGGRSFRYAPLSSGLEIVRKTLSQQGIAALQTTAVDQTTGTITLTTVLAHASGEWIASHWPICSIEDVATPHRMGAALTYARRYALFTLVGIAGEDDLDAPDLNAVPNTAAPAPHPSDPRKQEGNGQAAAAQATPRHSKHSEASARTILATQLSASLREGLIGQLPAINSADEAAAWAHRNLPAKNTLTAADAKMVEKQFQARLSTFSDSLNTNDLSEARAVESEPGARHKTVGRAKKQSRPNVVQALGKAVRLRDKDHRKYVLRQPCLVCGRVPSDPHHLTFTQPRALGRRVSDEFTVPVCRVHHRELHHSGDEAAWWRRLNIDPIPVALELWQRTRSDNEPSPVPQAQDSR